MSRHSSWADSLMNSVLLADQWMMHTDSEYDSVTTEYVLNKPLYLIAQNMPVIINKQIIGLSFVTNRNMAQCSRTIVAINDPFNMNGNRPRQFLYTHQ